MKTKSSRTRPEKCHLGCKWQGYRVEQLKGIEAHVTATQALGAGHVFLRSCFYLIRLSSHYSL